MWCCTAVVGEFKVTWTALHCSTRAPWKKELWEHQSKCLCMQPDTRHNQTTARPEMDQRVLYHMPTGWNWDPSIRYTHCVGNWRKLLGLGNNINSTCTADNYFSVVKPLIYWLNHSNSLNPPKLSLSTLVGCLLIQVFMQCLCSGHVVLWFHALNLEYYQEYDSLCPGNSSSLKKLLLAWG